MSAKLFWLYLNLIHELHGLNDADSLALRDLVTFLAEGGFARSWGPVKAACHGGCHLHMPAISAANSEQT